MFRLRSARHADLERLFYLSSLSTLLNLPHDRGWLLERIEQSIESFSGERTDPRTTYYTFVLENPAGEVIGTSAIKGQMGTREDPHVSFRVGEVEKYSKALDRHFRHRTLKLSFNYEGPTEIASIIMDPAHRGVGQKLGRQLSFVRFLYMAARPERFRDTVIAEMLPPHVSEGWSPLWDAVGKRLTGLDYVEADRLSKQNKNFIEKLFPHEAIYVTFLPEEAQAMVGAVAEQTIPAVKLLERVGFEYEERVDPFDGGPHYQVAREKITVIREAKSGTLAAGEPDGEDLYLVGVDKEGGEFVAVMTEMAVDGDRLVISAEALERLECEAGAAATGTPIVPAEERSA